MGLGQAQTYRGSGELVALQHEDLTDLLRSLFLGGVGADLDSNSDRHGVPFVSRVVRVRPSPVETLDPDPLPQTG